MIVCESFRLTTNRNEVKMRNYDEVLNKLEVNREYHRCFLELLENIQIKRKKDGTHFANKNQTFINANYINNTGVVYKTNEYPELKLVGSDKKGIWQEYSIYCYIYADELPKDDERRKEPVHGLRQTIILTTDEIIEKIEQEKERQKEYIKQYDRQIEESGKIFDLVSEKLEDLKNTLYESTKEFREREYNKSSLEYALIDYIKYNL